MLGCVPVNEVILGVGVNVAVDEACQAEHLDLLPRKRPHRAPLRH